MVSSLVDVHWLLQYCTVSSLFWLIVSYVLLNFTVQIIYYRFFHALKNFPGPFWWTVTRFPLAWSSARGKEVERSRELIEKYGNVVRISPTMLLVSTATTLPAIYHRTAKKTPHYTLFSFGSEGTIFHMREHADYASRAKTVAGIYTSRAHMPSTERVMDANISSWIEELRRRFTSQAKEMEFDISKWVQFLTMDTVTELGFGLDNKLGNVQHGRDMLGISGGFKAALPFYGIVCRFHTIATFLQESWFGRVVDWVMLNLDWQFGKMLRFVDNMIQKRLAENSSDKNTKREDMLQSFIDARTPDGRALSDVALRGEVSIVLMAGADNTTAAICTTLVRILRSPSALVKVMKELKSARETGSLSHVPQQAEILQHCPFYVACVKESLRLNPSLPSIIPRFSTSDVDNPLIIDGMVIPPNTEVASNPFITQRDPHIYGADAEDWLPERWLDSQKAKLMEKYNFTFGFGSRPCLGRQLGMMSTFKVPLMLLSTFETSIAKSSNPKIRVRADFSYWENFKIVIK